MQTRRLIKALVHTQHTRIPFACSPSYQLLHTHGSPHSNGSEDSTKASSADEEHQYEEVGKGTAPAELGGMTKRLQELSEQSRADAGNSTFDRRAVNVLASDIEGPKVEVTQAQTDERSSPQRSKGNDLPALRPLRSTISPSRRRQKQSSGYRLATARDQSSIYTSTKEGSLSDEERERMRQDLKDRFQPGARPMPTTIQGIRSLANERIEDAISRGLFNNLPRGKQIDRDHNASSPFIDTTEYLLNRLVQRQDIVPPWIEKQQELAREVQTFRGRLRNDWKRHAARQLSSRGGTLSDQMASAKSYARAELVLNPKAKPTEQLKRGSIEALATMDENEAQDLIGLVIAESPALEPGSKATAPQDATPSAEPSPRLFRDPAWETAEHSYHELCISSLNSLTRSYNLMAPDLAKRPYFKLERELSAVYRDVAPQLASEIYARATAPRAKEVHLSSYSVAAPGNHLFTTQTATVFDEKKPRYGLKEFLRDLWRTD